MFILGSQVSAIGSQVQAFGTRYGYGTFLHLHPNLNTRTRCLTAETRDQKNGSPLIIRSPVPLEQNYPYPYPFLTPHLCTFAQAAGRFALLHCLYLSL